MGKKKHSKDPMYVTATEWKDSYGGKKNRSTQGGYQLPFDACAMTLGPFETPVCSGDGVVFDILNVVPYIKKYHKNPVTGEAMSSKDLIRLNFAKNADGKFHCPVTCKVFNDNSKIVAIGTTGNVFAAEAVQELNVKAKNWAELLTGDPFTRKDIIKIYDKTDAELCARRDVSNFVHLKEVREDSARAASAASHTSKIRQNRTTSQVFQEIDAVRSQEAAEAKKKLEEDAAAVAEAEAQGIALGHRIWHRAPHKLFTSDFKEGSEMTTGAASHSFTSSAVGIATVNAMRQPTLDEINDARWSRLRALKKKAYVRLETSYGNINVEVHCDFVPRTAENFIALCERGYYDGCKVHRSIRNFMMQTGDPTGTGKGGESIWGGKFKDDFDSRLEHDRRGVVSMANSGKNTNGSQFFITYKSAPNLNLKHAIFGRVVGGLATLDLIEAVETDPKDVPREEVIIRKATVFQSPIAEMEDALERELLAKIEARETEAVPAKPAARAKPMPVDDRVGKYLPTASQGPAESASPPPPSSIISETAAMSGSAPKKAKKSGGGGFGNFSSW